MAEHVLRYFNSPVLQMNKILHVYLWSPQNQYWR